MLRQAQVIIVDQVSIALPLLRLAAPRSRLLFYCHFPDKLLFPHTGAIYRAYRVPLNWLEEVTTGGRAGRRRCSQTWKVAQAWHRTCSVVKVVLRLDSATRAMVASPALAPRHVHHRLTTIEMANGPNTRAYCTAGAAHEILVNSAFTAAAFRRGFPRLAARGLQPAVLHPAVSIPSDQALADAAAAWADELPLELAAFASQGRGPLFLSINRFERKKGIGLALRALAELLQRRPGCDARLIIAGEQATRMSKRRLRPAGVAAMRLPSAARPALPHATRTMTRACQPIAALCALLLLLKNGDRLRVLVMYVAVPDATVCNLTCCACNPAVLQVATMCGRQRTWSTWLSCSVKQRSCS